MKLLVPAFLLLFVFGSLTEGEVVNDFFKTCGVFFAPDKPPTTPPSPVHRRPTVLQGARYKQICQRLNNLYYYATLYDTTSRIPVYSAYQFTGFGGCDRQTFWYIEPQLDVSGPNLNNMETESKVSYPYRGTNQAVSCDYEGTGFDKGHLAPVFQQNVQLCAEATFTLTNAAPQDTSFNRGSWKVTEKNVAIKLDTDCLKKGYQAHIVTGVIPSNNWLTYKQRLNTVNIPSHFWTAYCCVDNNGVTKVSGSYYGANQNIPPQLKTIAQLDVELSKHYTPGFQVFGGNC